MARESVFTHDVLPRIRAGHPVLSIITYEWERVQNMLDDSSGELGRRLLKWSNAEWMVQVLEERDGITDWYDLTLDGEEIAQRFEDAWTNNVPQNGPSWPAGRVGRCAPDYLLWWYKNTPGLEDTVLWLEDITPYLDPTVHGASSIERRALVRRIRDFCVPDDRTATKTVVMTFPQDYLAEELVKDVEQFVLPLPKEAEMAKLLELQLESWNEDNPDSQVKAPTKAIKGKFARAALGLTWQEAGSSYKQIFARMAMEGRGRSSMRDSDIGVMHEQKAQIINKTGVLEFISHKEGIEDIGGMDNLKSWLEVHRGALEDETDPPKGLLMMGVPGCGKSLMARAVAQDWELPLLALKASNIFDKYVGESEGKIASALAIAEAISPCVLWIDELEKLLAGSGGDGSLDSGVSARMGGSLLSWMADKDEPVFVVATANNPERLDPAYVRRGRFDERFFIDLPGKGVREQIFEIHLRKRFPDMDMGGMGLPELASASNGFTGAEIEACIVEAKNKARPEAPDHETLLGVVEGMTPDAVAMTDAIQHIRRLWGGDRARRADSGPAIDLSEEGGVYDKEISEAAEKSRRGIRKW